MPKGKRKQRVSALMQNVQDCNKQDEELSVGTLSNKVFSLSSTNQSSITVSITSLPHIVINQIIDCLLIRDVQSLICVNRFFYNFISSRYTTNVDLPGDPQNLSLPTNFTLSLNISCNLSQLPPINCYQNLQLLNLRKLKKLQLTGKNHIWNKQYLLSDRYKNSLEYLLHRLNKISIQELEYLTDESKRCTDIVKSVSSFHNLTVVTLHGIGYINQAASYHMDKDIAQKIINNVLSNCRLKILNLKSFHTLNRCLVIESDSLEELYVDFGKNFEIGLLYLPRVRIINMETSVWFGCFYHAQNGELKKIVAQGCPKLEIFNGIDLLSLAELSESNHWMEELQAFSASRQLGEVQCALCFQPE